MIGKQIRPSTVYLKYQCIGYVPERADTRPQDKEV